MARKTWHWNSELGKLVEGPSPPRGQTSMHVMDDITPFVSPIDKTVIGSRPQLEAHNKRHGVTNSADYSPDFIEKRGKNALAEQDRVGDRQREQALYNYLTEREK